MFRPLIGGTPREYVPPSCPACIRVHDPGIPRLRHSRADFPRQHTPDTGYRGHSEAVALGNVQVLCCRFANRAPFADVHVLVRRPREWKRHVTGQGGSLVSSNAHAELRTQQHSLNELSISK